MVAETATGTARTEPALVFVTLLGAAVACLLAFGNFDVTTSGVIVAAAGAVGTLVTAALARPVNVALIGGAAGTLLSSLIVFNIHLTDAQTGSIVAGITLVLGMLLRTQLTPAAGRVSPPA